MKLKTLVILIILELIILFALFVYKKKNLSGVDTLKVDTLKQEFLSDPMKPVSEADYDTIKKLKDLGYCAGYGGRGIVAARFVCKKGATFMGYKCNC